MCYLLHCWNDISYGIANMTQNIADTTQYRLERLTSSFAVYVERCWECHLCWEPSHSLVHSYCLYQHTAMNAIATGAHWHKNVMNITTNKNKALSAEWPAPKGMSPLQRQHNLWLHPKYFTPLATQNSSMYPQQSWCQWLGQIETHSILSYRAIPLQLLCTCIHTVAH